VLVEVERTATSLAAGSGDGICVVGMAVGVSGSDSSAIPLQPAKATLIVSNNTAAKINLLIRVLLVNIILNNNSD
jgi:hypothetical protein